MNPSRFMNSFISIYRLKMKVGYAFDCGREFSILLDISVHSLLKESFSLSDVVSI